MKRVAIYPANGGILLLLAPAASALLRSMTNGKEKAPRAALLVGKWVIASIIKANIPKFQILAFKILF